MSQPTFLFPASIFVIARLVEDGHLANCAWEIDISSRASAIRRLKDICANIARLVFLDARLLSPVTSETVGIVVMRTGRPER